MNSKYCYFHICSTSISFTNTLQRYTEAMVLRLRNTTKKTPYFLWCSISLFKSLWEEALQHFCGFTLWRQPFLNTRGVLFASFFVCGFWTWVVLYNILQSKFAWIYGSSCNLCNKLVGWLSIAWNDDFMGNTVCCVLR